MPADRTSDPDDFRRGRVLDEIHEMRHARMDGMALQHRSLMRHHRLPGDVIPPPAMRRDGQADVQPDAARLRHADGDLLPVHFGFDDSGTAFKPHGLGRDLLQIREPRHAAGAVPAEIGLAAVVVVKPPAEIVLAGLLQENESVRADREMAAADTGHEGRHLPGVDHAVPVVHDDEIVAGAGKFHEGDFFHCRTRSHYGAPWLRNAGMVSPRTRSAYSSRARMTWNVPSRTSTSATRGREL